MSAPIRNHAILVVWLTLTVAVTIRAQDSASDEVVQMEAFSC